MTRAGQAIAIAGLRLIDRLFEFGNVKGSSALRCVVIFLAVCFTAMPASGHHSDAGMAVDSIVAIEGAVTEFTFRNSHVYVAVETTNVNGDSVEWSLQMRGINGLSRRGWRADTPQVDDQVA
jgi:hypothetical protein